MRDTDLMLALLREMADQPDGRVAATVAMGASEDCRRRHHHVEILVDARYAEWAGEGMARITNAGYDFLNAVSQDDEQKSRFRQLLAQGMSLLEAGSRIVDSVGKLAG